mmetsp:Transcript_14945/g.18768  ORF Transcript_14945/g.18768 Transcript_14945/m.18768 type:complete len:93 (-) Transcript_14945:53-331(-)
MSHSDPKQAGLHLSPILTLCNLRLDLPHLSIWGVIAIPYSTPVVFLVFILLVLLCWRFSSYLDFWILQDCDYHVAMTSLARLICATLLESRG